MEQSQLVQQEGLLQLIEQEGLPRLIEQGGLQQLTEPVKLVPAEPAHLLAPIEGNFGAAVLLAHAASSAL